MARMSREFSLVLLGAGVLTAGYFLISENEDLIAKEEKQVTEQVQGSRRGGYHPGFIFIHGGAMGSNGRVSSSAIGNNGIARGGFGRIGSATVGG
jgi:hypothetical protein